MVSSGAVQAQQLREGADKLDAYERLVRATMKARTRLTPDQAAIYVNRTVLLNADDAQRDGVIDAVAAFSVPPGARSAMIASAPRRSARPSCTTQLTRLASQARTDRRRPTRSLCRGIPMV